MRPHLTHTFHGKAQQKERLTWAGAAQQAEVSAGAGGPYLVFCKRSRDHRGQLRTRTGSAQRWSNPTRTPPCGQTGHAASTPQHPRSWGWGGPWGLRGKPGAGGMVWRLEARLGARGSAVFSLGWAAVSPGWGCSPDLPQFTPWAYPLLIILLSSPFSSSF